MLYILIIKVALVLCFYWMIFKEIQGLKKFEQEEFRIYENIFSMWY
jgi:hypothetical protein